MRSTRLADMERYIRQNGTVSMEALCSHFNISMNTVRRDIIELRKRGLVEKVYGGVTVSGQDVLKSFNERSIVDADEKQAAGLLAAQLVEEKDVIFLDSGTTTIQLIPHFSVLNELTLVTNNLAAIREAELIPGINIIMLPGQVQRNTDSVTGSDTAKAIRSFNINKAFMAATGTTESGVTNSSPFGYEVKKAVMETAKEKILVIGCNKFGVPGLMTYAHFEDFDYIVTNAKPPEPYAAAIMNSGARLIVGK